MIRFLFRGCLWVYTAWCTGDALGAVLLGNTSDVIRYGLFAATGGLALVFSHVAHRQRRRVHGGDA